jgi:hypothetical protein
MDKGDLANLERQEKALRCACGKEGVSVWEVGSGPGGTLVSVTDDFHLETGRANGDAPLIVCNACDSFQVIE